MRIVQLQCKWKDEISADEIHWAKIQVNGDELVYEYAPKNNTKSKIIYVSSHPLSKANLDYLWAIGDLHLTDKEYWKSESIDGIFDQIHAHMAGVKAEEEEPKTKTKIPFCPALEDPEVAAKVNIALEGRTHADYNCYMALRDIVKHGITEENLEEATEAVRIREEYNEKFMLLASGRTT